MTAFDLDALIRITGLRNDREICARTDVPTIFKLFVHANRDTNRELNQSGCIRLVVKSISLIKLRCKRSLIHMDHSHTGMGNDSHTFGNF